MKEFKKISLKTIENVLTRSELKRIMAGSGSDTGGSCSSPNAPYPCTSDDDCKKICERTVAYCANTNGVKNCQFCCN